jgi:hypothetical protein
MARKRKQTETETISTIFGENAAITAQEREALAKKLKAEKRAQQKEKRRAMRREIIDRLLPSESRKSVLIACGVIGVLLIGIAVAIIVDIRNNNWEALEGRTYYVDYSEVPEEVEGKVTGVVNEVYYTQNGGLYVYFNFYNGRNTPQRPAKVHFRLYNEKEQVIAATSTTDIEQDYYILSGNLKGWEMFIPKKFVQIPDDSLEIIMYDLEIESETHE